MIFSLKRMFLVFCGCFYIQVIMAYDGLLVFDQKAPSQFIVRKIEDLKISGSPQFSQEELFNALKLMQGEVWIVDLRRESHGYVNGFPISWYFPYNRSNIGLSTNFLLTQEAHQINVLKPNPSLTIQKIKEKKAGKIIRTTSISVVPYSLETEQQLCQRFGLQYLRLPVTDHSRPNDQEVNDFVEFVKNQPKNSWLHFHCRGGKGRTTTFIVLYDILKNAKSDSLNMIISRQRSQGTTDVFKIAKNAEELWKKDLQIERKKFLESFYAYAHSEEGYPKKNWHEWLNK